MRLTKKNSALFYLIPVTLLTATLLFCSIHALRIYLPQRRDENSMASLRQEIVTESGTDRSHPYVNPYKAVMAQNGDFACWLKIPDSIIDYPVMKTSENDPEYYLRRGFDKKYSYAGCLFIGGGCNLDSDSFIIYGHNLDADIMFGELDLYADPSYALKHRQIQIGTPTEARTYRVFAAFQTRVSDKDDGSFKYYEQIGSLDEPTYRDTVAQIRALSLIDLADAPQYPAQLLLLSTCSYHTKNGRFVVAAYRVNKD